MSINQHLKVSRHGIDLIKSFEGLELEAYLDTLAEPDIWTIGYGHVRTAKKGMKITEEEAEELLRDDVSIKAETVRRCVNVPLTQNQFDALVSFHYNTGRLHKSTLLRKLNEGNYNAVGPQLARWKKAGGKVWPGLVRRRAAESELFYKDDFSGETPTPIPGRVEPEYKPYKDVAKDKNIWAGILAVLSSISAWMSDIFSDIGETAAEVNTKVTQWESLYNFLGTNAKYYFLVITIVAAIGIVMSRAKAKREMEDG